MIEPVSDDWCLGFRVLHQLRQVRSIMHFAQSTAQVETVKEKHKPPRGFSITKPAQAKSVFFAQHSGKKLQSELTQCESVLLVEVQFASTAAEAFVFRCGNIPFNSRTKGHALISYTQFSNRFYHVRPRNEAHG